MLMEAAVLRELKKPLSIETLKVPLLSYGQVLVKVFCASICGAQINEIEGSNGDDKYLPHLLGHEGSGIVSDIGPGVKHVDYNDIVIMHWRKGKGIEAEQTRYLGNGGECIGAGPITTFSTYSVVSENRLTVIPEQYHYSYDILSLFGCAVTTGFGLINNEAKLKLGQSIAVAGCGGVGLNIIHAADLVSANTIVGIDYNMSKLDIAKKLGANLVTSNIDSITPVDVFVDCTGDPYVIERGLDWVVPGGKMILVGQPNHDCTIQFRNFRKHYCGKTIIDSQGGLTDPNEDIIRYLRLYEKGKLKIDETITHTFSLLDINKAFDLMGENGSGRCIIDMTL